LFTSGGLGLGLVILVVVLGIWSCLHFGVGRGRWAPPLWMWEMADQRNTLLPFYVLPNLVAVGRSDQGHSESNQLVPDYGQPFHV